MTKPCRHDYRTIVDPDFGEVVECAWCRHRPRTVVALDGRLVGYVETLTAGGTVRVVVTDPDAWHDMLNAKEPGQ